jgi:hypothetical protein
MRRGDAHYSSDRVAMPTSPLPPPRRVSCGSLLQELQVRSRDAIRDFCRRDFGCLVCGYGSAGSRALGFREVICSRGGSLFAFSPRMYVRYLLQRVNLGDRVLFFTVLCVDFAWKRWKIEIGHRLRFFDCCFLC